jgi:O-antigen ligase
MSDTARRFVVGILLFAMVGGTVELLLLGHVEDPPQWIPLVLMGLGVAALVTTAVRPTMGGVRLLRALMALFILSGFVGMSLHFKANLEFQKEVDPSLAGRALVWKALRAKAPPALAPGMMVQLGLLGLVYTYGHPILNGRKDER